MASEGHGDELTGFEVAVVGMAGRFPGADDLDAFWENLVNGVESVRFFTPEELEGRGADPAVVRDPAYVPAHAALDEIEGFDAAFFGFNPREAQILNPQYRLFLEIAWQAMEAAGRDPHGLPGAAAVFAGSSSNYYLEQNVVRNPSVLESVGFYQAALSNLKDTLATRVSYKLDLEGPSWAVQSACSTSLVAIHAACQSLIAEECDFALAGGVSITLPQMRGYLYREGMILSPDGHCRAFDAKAKGTVLGDGVGVVVLRRLADALADGDPIRAVVLGSAANNDGADKVGFTAPGLDGQVRVIREALELAGADVETIGLVEAHGTGTALGDPIEMAALAQGFGPGGRAAVGSVKANIGHLDAAAGVASFIKTVLALERGEIPPSVNFDEPNPEIDWASGPFFVARERLDFPRRGGPRRAAVSSFGMGGTNAHVILEEAPRREVLPAARRGHQLLVLSAPTAGALEAMEERLADHLRAAPDVALADVAHTLESGRRPFAERRAVVAADAAEAAGTLSDPSPRRSVAATAAERPTLVFLFPGQGAQYPGMGHGLYRGEPVFRQEVDRCCELLEPHLELDLRQVLYPEEATGDEAAERLRRTEMAQPALFVTGWALARLWSSWGIEASAVAGHSIGEITAACHAGVLDLEGALAMVAARGRLMGGQPPGDMLAVPLPEEEVVPLLDPELSVGALNAPGMSVVSGPAPAVAGLVERLAERGIEGRILETSHAFHSPMMDPILEPFRAVVSRLAPSPPRIPLVSTVTGEPMDAERATDPGHWVENVRRPVRFAAAAERLLADGHRLFLEVGPGNTLGSLVRLQGAAAEDATCVSSLRHPREDDSDPARALLALGGLWTAGYEVDWERFRDGERRRRVVLPGYPFEHRTFWVEPAEEQRRVRLPGLADPAERFYAPVWTGAPRPSGAATAGGRIVVFADGHGVAEGLAERLRAADREVALVRAAEAVGLGRDDDGTYSFDPRRPEAYEALVRELVADEPEELALVHLWSLAPPPAEPLAPEALAAALEPSYFSLLYLARAVDRVAPAVRTTLHAVANHHHRVVGDDLLCPEKALVVGACRVTAQEIAALRAVAVDVDLPTAGGGAGDGRDETVEALAAEVLAPGDEAVVVLRRGERWHEEFRRVRLERPGELPLVDGGTYLITGGLGGIGRVLAEHLAGVCRARLVLTGRSELPPRERWGEVREAAGADDRTARKIAALERLEGMGAEVLPLAADVADPEAMAAVVAAARERFGPLSGVIHAAGTQIDGAVESRSPETSAAVLDPKVRGTLVVDRAVAGEPLDFFLVMSSMSSLVGGVAQVDYCAANAFLDAFAHGRSRRRDRPGRSLVVNWDAWQEVGMAARFTRGESAEQRRAWLAPEEGCDAFDRILGSGLTQVIATKNDFHALAERFADLARRPEAAPEEGVEGEAADDRRGLSSDYLAPEGPVEEAIAVLWEEMLGVGRVGAEDDFFELGGHSLLATQVVSRLNERFAVELSLAEVLAAPTVRELAEHVEAARRAGEEEPALVGEEGAEEEREEFEV